MFLDGAQLVVDRECERVLPGWVPRRLGEGVPITRPVSFSVSLFSWVRFWLSLQQVAALEGRRNQAS